LNNRKIFFCANFFFPEGLERTKNFFLLRLLFIFGTQDCERKIKEEKGLKNFQSVVGVEEFLFQLNIHQNAKIGFVYIAN
jgi:hypothetical protein